MPGTRKFVQLYRNRELIESSNNNSALENAKLTVENLTPADGEVVLVRYKEDDSDIVKSLVAVYHAEIDNEDSGWTFLTPDDYYSKEEIDETERVIASALAQLDGDITTLSEVVENNAQIVENNELVTARALIDLNSRINSIDVQYLNEIKYSELVALRNSNGLTPGMLYRITDYVTTTSQEDTNSAGHKFDIIVLALSNNKLSENAYAIQHKSDTYFANSNLNAWEIKYCLDNDATRFEWAIEPQMVELRLYKCDGYNKGGEGNMFFDDGGSALDRSEWFTYIGTMNYNGETYYAWKKYEGNGYERGVIILTEELYMPDSLNTGNTYSENFNGTAAEIAYTMVSDGEVNYTAEGFNDSEYSDSYVCLSEFDTQISGDDSVLFEMGEGNGKGVIYYMKDEFNNECPYDFKNIQFKRKITDGELDINSGVDTWLYTFTWIDENDNVKDASIVAQTMLNDEGYAPGVHNNSMLSAKRLSNDSKLCFTLNDNVFIYSSYYDPDFFYGTYSNTFGSDCTINTFGSCCSNNTFGDNCYNNTFGSSCYNNTIGSGCYNNTLGNNCDNNTFGNKCNGNTFEHSCTSNTFGNKCNSNTFGYSCYNNTLGNGCYNNTFVNSCAINTFGIGCYYNTFGIGCNNNTFGNNCYRNGFGNGCNSNRFGIGCYRNTFGNGCYYNTFGNGCYNNTFGDSCYNNSFVNNCYSNRFGIGCYNNTFSINCYMNTFGHNCDGNTFGNDCNQITLSKQFTTKLIIESGNQSINLTSSQNTSSSNVLRNITIAQGVNNTNTIKTISHNTLNDTFRTVYQPTDSMVVSV